MKVWVDLTASAHPLVFRPLVQLLEAQGLEDPWSSAQRRRLSAVLFT